MLLLSAKVLFRGKSYRKDFGYSLTTKPRLNLLRIEEELSATYLRLAGATIECLPYYDILTRYDRADTLFYLDQPHHGFEEFYGKNVFSQENSPPLRIS